jgi:hypothetical protein
MSPSADEVAPSVTNAAHGETIATQGESQQIPGTNGATNGHSNGTNGVNGASDNGANTFHYGEEVTEGTPYRVLQQYHSKPTKLRVACVGAGASGLCLAYKMERMMIPGSWELTLFEKNPHFGGTWYENRYPGVACDVSQFDYLKLPKHLLIRCRSPLHFIPSAGTPSRTGLTTSPTVTRFSDTSRALPSATVPRST